MRGMDDDARGNSGLSMCNGAQATLGPSGARALMHVIGNNDNGDRDNDDDNDNIIAIQGHIAKHDYGDCGCECRVMTNMICQHTLPNVEIPSRQTQGHDANAARPT